MARERLTARRCETACVHSGKALALRDASVAGLELIVGTSGTKTWSFNYTRSSDGKRRRVGLGHFPGFSLEDARKRAAELRRVVDEGGDPAQAKADKREADTFAELVADWLALHGERKKAKRSLIDDKSMLNGDVLPQLGSMKASQVTKRDVVKMLDKVEARDVKVRTNRVLALVRSIYRWGVGRDRVQFDPTMGIAKYSKEVARDRVLSAAEITKFWKRLDTAMMSDASKLAMKLLLVTAQRESMVCEMARSELDLKAGVWTIPKARTKSGLGDHTVPLSPLALELIAEAERLAGDSPWLFPSQKGRPNVRKNAPPAPDQLPINGNSLGVATRRTAADGEGWSFPHFTVHDLRRTAASGMGDLGFGDDVIGRVLHHAKKDVTRIYNRSDYLPQKRAALEAWAGHLEVLLGMRAAQTNVVALRA